MALALYRKYRPRTFAEVIGQEHVTEPLSRALRGGRLNHAYLFSGPRGCGKTSSARILARSLNCEHGPTPEPCGTCDSCRALATDGAGSIDVIEIDAASHGGVDDARELREKAFFAPAQSRFKIYVIDEAHMVSSAGFNALLKLVEEPPEYVKFVFATTEPEKVLGTIKSRTHHYPFRLIPPKVLRPYLEQLCQAEDVQVEPAVFPLVVRAGGGSARDSLSVLDQLIAGAGPEGVTYVRAAALLGVTDSALIDEMCDALAAGDGAAAYVTVDRVAEAGHDPRRFAADLLERLRDLIVLQQVPDAVAKGLIDGPDDQVERMTSQAQRLGPGTLSRCADIVHDGLVEMRGTTAPRLLLELISARMLLPGVDDSAGGLLQRLERMERRLALAGTDVPAAAGSVPTTDHPEVRPASPAAGVAPAAATGDPAGPSGVAAARVAAANASVRAGARSTAASGAGPDEPAAAHDTPVRVRAATAADSGPTDVAVSDGVGGPGGGGELGGRTTPEAAGATRGPVAPADPGSPGRRSAPPPAVMPDPATPAPPRPGAVAPGALDAVAVRRAWPEVVSKVNRTNKRIAALMRDAVVRDLDGDTLVLTVKSSVLARMVADHAVVLTDALYEELGGRWQIRCEVAGERGGASRPASSPARSGSSVLSGSAEGSPGRDAAGGANGSTGGRDTTGGAGDANDGAGHDRAPGPGGAGGGAGDHPGGAAGRGDGSGHGLGGRAAGSDDGSASGDDTDWPEPARPGGAAGNDEDWPAPARAGGDAGGAGDWPEPARPGGATAAADAGVAWSGGGSAAADPVAGPGGGGASADRSGAAALSAVPRLAGPAAAQTGGASVSSAIAAARAAAAAAGAGKGQRAGVPARRTADPNWAGEPPYDPDHDGAARRGGARAAPTATPVYEGFDPGDEPLDEVIDERTARQSSEEQAVQLLREAFGAETINEVDA
ncbi:DNA polymerase III subunit gamma and tau [Micromonospora sp. WMMA1363]|uniref:DNA polymerase III subunit gamma and tau n=1 Tax=Micromonospora sp. WMMA1363 TaxID=3053985 RepID=UPI00259CB177|nr:DNA polymerase III subunit gamma and tau [Micromonospora sp. WMMA1363]MDM4721421.1 DNA polymerase III subunit gamma and tau [Micromonospora sp. WMMA1363]